MKKALNIGCVDSFDCETSGIHFRNQDFLGGILLKLLWGLVEIELATKTMQEV